MGLPGSGKTYLAKRFSKSVFAPQSVPRDYLQKVGVELSRREFTIEANSEDLAQTAIALSGLAKNYYTLTLPIEVIPMATNYVSREIIKLGGNPILRKNQKTDNGNVILDINVKFICIKNS